MVTVTNKEMQPAHCCLMDPKETAEYLKMDAKTITRGPEEPTFRPIHSGKESESFGASMSTSFRRGFPHKQTALIYRSRRAKPEEMRLWATV